MTQPRRAAREPRRSAAAARRPRDLGAVIALGVLAAGLLATALLVDDAAESAFDAPKRLAAVIAIVLAAAALALVPRGDAGPAAVSAPARREAPWSVRAVPWLFLAALVGASVSAALSPRPAVSLDAWRALALFAVLLPLGASRALEAGGGRVLLVAFLVAGAVNAVVSLLEAGGLVRPFRLMAFSGRAATGALAGNEGYVALALVPALLAALATVLLARRPAIRVVGAAGLLLFLAGIVVNRNLSALLALLAGTVVILAARFRGRILWPLALVLLVVVGGVAGYPPFRDRAQIFWRDARAGDLNRVVTYRLGPWAAALEMARARPLAGWGPGTFAAEFAPHRLEAEMRYRTRLANPYLAGSYTEAHSDYLQLLAEVGVPAAMAAMSAAALLLAGLLSVAWRPESPDRADAILLATLLVAGAVAAVSWFPFQRTITAVPLLLAAGRAWRITAGPVRAGGMRRGLAVVAIAILGLALVPELSRYAAERRLGHASGGLQALFAGATTPADVAPRLEWVATTAAGTARDLPGDWRPLSLTAAARLLGRRADLALDVYRAALAIGERPEIELNMGRAHMVLGQREAAQIAFIRAGWVSPAVLRSLPVALRTPMEAEVARLEGELRAGRLQAPPPPPR